MAANFGENIRPSVTNGVMVSDSVAFSKNKSCRQHASSAEVDVGDSSSFLTEWWGTNCE